MGLHRPKKKKNPIRQHVKDFLPSLVDTLKFKYQLFTPRLWHFNWSELSSGCCVTGTSSLPCALRIVLTEAVKIQALRRSCPVVAVVVVVVLFLFPLSPPCTHAHMAAAVSGAAGSSAQSKHRRPGQQARGEPHHTSTSKCLHPTVSLWSREDKGWHLWATAQSSATS